MSIWLPGFEHRDLGPDGGSYDRRTNPKLLWHTWEGYSWSSAESAFARYPPHIAVNPRDRVRRQYVDLDRHAYALAGSDTEDSWVIQVEVAGFARQTHEWPPDYIAWLGQEVLAPIVAAVPIPPVVTALGFHGEGEGIILASPNSPIRFRSIAAWDAFSGHVGHQHAPSPDAHWDPGRLNVAAIIAASNTTPAPPAKDEDMNPTHCVDRDGRHWFFIVGGDADVWASVDDSGFWVLLPRGPDGKPRSNFTSGLSAITMPDGRVTVAGRGGDGRGWQIVFTPGDPTPPYLGVIDSHPHQIHA